MQAKCPFCGGDDLSIACTSAMARIRCRGCKADGPPIRMTGDGFEDTLAATRAWNTRTEGTSHD